MRVVLDRPGVIRLANGPETNTQLTEISEGGLRCGYAETVALGASVELRFTLPLATPKDCLVFGRVQHRHQEGNTYILGIEFNRTAGDVLGAIRTFVQMRQSAK